MTANGHAESLETVKFLPSNGFGDSTKNGKYIVTISPKKEKDLEALEKLNVDARPYDPFEERNVEHPTSDCDTLTHLLKASLGTGILAMPMAFKNSGVTVGVFCMILVSVVCTHCSYIVVKCAHVLYYRTKVSSMSFPDVGEAAFTNGPPWGRKFAKLARFSIQAGLFTTYFGACSVYTVIIAHNLQQVVDHYLGIQLDQRVYIMALLLPLILLSWVPNLKALAPVSMVANVFMGLGLGITLYYLVQDLPSPADLPQSAPISQLPVFFSISIFAIEAIGSVMPLENSMATPRHFIGTFGVLNQGMSGVTVVYILIGFLGYVKYGDDTKGSITLNLPQDELAAQSVKVLVALAVFCTYGLQYYVCLEIVWNGLKKNCSNNPRLAQYIVRTVLTTATVLLAVTVPTIGPFVGLIGALCFSLLGLIFPVVIEIITYWDIGFGNWLVFKNVFLFVFGVMALVFGSYTSVLDIIKELGGSSNATESASSLKVTETVMNLLLNSTHTPTADTVNTDALL